MPTDFRNSEEKMNVVTEPFIPSAELAKPSVADTVVSRDTTPLFIRKPNPDDGWAIYELVMDNPAAASGRGTEALTDAVAIVLGIIIVFELPQKRFRRLAGQKPPPKG